MKKLLLSLSLVAAMILPASAQKLFFYSPEDGNGGLRFAVSQNGSEWTPIGNNLDFVKSDFGAWGSHKKMWNPQLFPTPQGWALLFRATPNGDVVGYTQSSDLVKWEPQQYFAPADTAKLTFRTNVGFSPNVVEINGNKIPGYEMNSDAKTVAKLQAYATKAAELAALYSEHCDKDGERFDGLQPVKATLTATGKTKQISPLLMGIFFEDINYAADGGLYAELIQNRDFEYSPSESGTKGWGHEYAWKTEGDKLDFSISTDNPVHPNNPHYAVVEVKGGLTAYVNSANALVNSGWDGITVNKGEPYKFTVKARATKKMPVDINLVDVKGRKIGSGKIKVEQSRDWKDYEVMLTPDEYSRNATLQIVPKANGTLNLDMVSLFPMNTFNNRPNGLRKDLAHTLANLKPRFIRFPGGCVAHGNGLDNVYDWKGSIGPLESRKPLSNLWGYHQTRGLGYYEYFQFCEDIGAEPLPVIAAAVPCQNSSAPSRFSHDTLTSHGQQQGLPLDSMGKYIQDILDLIEYANGPADSKWGAKRAEAGHPTPFNLKYIGIGNEDMITPIFEERFKLINDAVKKTYPEITVIGTVGPFYEGSDYDEGWAFARKENVDMVDEHYYVDPAWLIYNQDFYDNYDRKGPKVYLGEWAAHLPGRPSNIETALAEALYLTSVERNGDVVQLSSYAPLLAKEGHTQWRPDLIYFNNSEVKPTTDYETMRLFGENAGNLYFDETILADTEDQKAKARIGASVVKDEATGDIIVKMVNMLPVETTMTVDLKKLFPDSQGGINSVRTVMTGNPADVKSVVKTDRVSLPSPFFVSPLEPYSLTIMRLKP